MRQITGSIAGTLAGVIAGGVALLALFTVSEVATEYVPRHPGSEVKFPLALFYFAAIIASLVWGGLWARYIALLRKGSPLVAVVASLPVMLALAWFTLGVISFANCCEFGDGLPLGGEDCGC